VNEKTSRSRRTARPRRRREVAPAREPAPVASAHDLSRTRGEARILVVEDDADLRHLFSTHLALAGFSVESVQDGLAALWHIEQSPPDLLILDLGLPLMSGESVADELAASAQTRDIPVVVVTGQLSALPPSHAACVLWKPVALEHLVATVRRCLQQSALLAEERGPLRNQAS
jgi:DNA-binding response OmpR family regulator